MKGTTKKAGKKNIRGHGAKTRARIRDAQTFLKTEMGVDAETLFIRDFMGSDYSYDINPVSKYLLYNATTSTKRLAYGFGRYLGTRLNQESNTSKNLLPELLEKIGLGKTLYIPSEEVLTIKSTPNTTTNMGILAHIMEAGLISGYLSSFTSTKICTSETACAFNGDSFCKFESHASEADPDFSTGATEVNKISDSALSESSDTRVVTNSYYAILSMIPLLRTPLSTELSKLLYLAGSIVADRSAKGSEKNSLARISYFLDLEDAALEKRGVRTSIILKYKPYNSNIPFIGLSASMFAGFASSMFRREIAVESFVDKNRNYLVKLTTRRI